MDEELNSLQLDKPKMIAIKTTEQIQKHTIDQQFESKPIERSLHLLRKGDDVQKLSVIQALPQLLQFDANATLTRILPKIQQELPKSSCEFHVATSKVYKILLEKNLPVNLMTAVFQGAESKDPIISSAWMETMLAAIPLLSIDQVRNEVVPVAVTKSAPSNPVLNRANSSKILGKCAVHPKMTAADVKGTILPVVQGLCQDLNPDVRASMCSQLHYVAQGLGENLIKSSLLPNLVELAADNNMAVRGSAVGAVVLIIPLLTKPTRLETIVPLIKQLCQKSMSDGDTTFPTLSREFGRLLAVLGTDLEQPDCNWFLNFYKLLSRKGYASAKDNTDPNQAVICREQCAYNLPAVTCFVVNQIASQLEFWHAIFSDLANDPCYIVRKTVAGCIHEVIRLLGSQCKIIRQDVVRLLRDDADDVLLMLVPNIGMTLEYFTLHGVLSRDQAFQSTLEIARALLKCLVELSKGHNWRIKASFLEQMEHLTNCMPSDFIHQHFTPVLMNYALEPRSKPVKSQATRTLLVFLRYNLKDVHRKWIKDNLVQHLCNSKSCYTRQIYLEMCRHAIEVFSCEYFKKNFFASVLGMADDRVSNVRISVVMLFPALYKMLTLPEDRKLQTTLEATLSKMEQTERDRDVKSLLKVKMKELRTNTNNPGARADMIVEERRRMEEERRISMGKPVVNLSLSLLAAYLPAANSKNSAQASTTSSRTPGSAQHGSAASSPSRATVRSEGSGSGTGSNPSAVSLVSNRPGGKGAPKPPSAGNVALSSSMSENMSFLEHHFYVDAGVNLPRDVQKPVDEAIDNITKQFENKHLQNVEETNNNPTGMTNVVEITSSSNITDDDKVNLQKITERQQQTKKVTARDFLEIKKYSNSEFALLGGESANRKAINRRSLNLTVSDASSRIPVCKSKSDVKLANIGNGGVGSGAKVAPIKCSEKNCGDNARKLRVRPKSAVLVSSSGSTSMIFERSNRFTPCSDSSTTSTSKESLNNYSIRKSNAKENAPRASALPVLKRK